MAHVLAFHDTTHGQSLTMFIGRHKAQLTTWRHYTHTLRVPSQTDREQISIKKLHLNFTNPRITILWYARRLDTISVVQNFTYTTNFHIAHCLNSHCHFYEYLCYWCCFHKRHPARKNLCQFPNVLLLTELTQNPSPTSSNFEMKLAKQQRRK